MQTKDAIDKFSEYWLEIGQGELAKIYYHKEWLDCCEDQWRNLELELVLLRQSPLKWWSTLADVEKDRVVELMEGG